jgi:predicted PurR-regulated permease PerM
MDWMLPTTGCAIFRGSDSDFISGGGEEPMSKDVVINSKLSRRPWAIFFGLVVSLIALHLLPVIAQLLLVLFGGVLLAVILEGGMSWVMLRTGLKRPLVLLFVCVAFAAALGSAAWFLGSMMANQFDALGSEMSSAMERLREELEDAPFRNWILPGEGSTQGLPGGQLLGSLGGLFTSAFGTVANVAILLLLAIYLVVRPALYTDGLLKLIPRAKRARWDEILRTIASALRWWFLGRLASMTAVGVLTGLGLWMAGVPMALALGMLAGFLSFVPYIGTIAGAIPGVLVAWANGLDTAIYAVVVYVMVQALEGNLITPLIDKKAVSLPPAVLIACQLAFGVLFGIWGVIWGAPLAIVAMILVQMLYIQDVLKEEVEVLSGGTTSEDAKDAR